MTEKIRCQYIVFLRIFYNIGAGLTYAQREISLRERMIFFSWINLLHLCLPSCVSFWWCIWSHYWSHCKVVRNQEELSNNGKLHGRYSSTITTESVASPKMSLNWNRIMSSRLIRVNTLIQDYNREITHTWQECNPDFFRITLKHGQNHKLCVTAGIWHVVLHFLAAWLITHYYVVHQKGLCAFTYLSQELYDLWCGEWMVLLLQSMHT